MVNRNLPGHPYKMVKQLINEARTFLSGWREILFIEDNTRGLLQKQKRAMEEEHRRLFQQLWINFTAAEYAKRIERYVYRLKINNLSNGWLDGKRCIDFGCGHGNFAHALIHEGAAFVYALDYGQASIEFAIKARDTLGVGKDKIDFQVATVYDTGLEDESFDFAIQNGVFHHLDNEDRAYREVHRVLKKDGWFWIYTDGSGAISHDLWDASNWILRDVPDEFIIHVLGSLNIETGKRYHLGDGLNAIYRHTTRKALIDYLEILGFGNFRWLIGGFSTDFDQNVIDADKYGPEKFGEGDLRLLAQKIK
jgi:ubiquinone/menaquinone biosynthesis C-methylase UbiE